MISGTLFRYIFKDLIKIFMLTSTGIAGIMSFGGLLRPLTQQGLDGEQVALMLGYLMPAMTNYSWPIAALFATTFVYGRLSADNELTGARASGISYLSLLMPALVLGLVVSIVSLLFMLFVVPKAFLGAEQVIYSNMARLVAAQIDRKQKIGFDAGGSNVTIFANTARVLEADPAKSRQQAVQLSGVSIVTYGPTERNQPKVPSEFFMAENATIYITMPANPEDEVVLFARLERGVKLPVMGEGRQNSQTQVSLSTANAGPFPLRSPVRESPRFMDITRLHSVLSQPDKTRRMQATLLKLQRDDMAAEYLNSLYADLTRGGRYVSFKSIDGTTHTIYAGQRTPRNQRGALVLSGGTAEQPGIIYTESSDASPFNAVARELSLMAFPDSSTKTMLLSADMIDAKLTVDEQEVARRNIERRFTVAMPAFIDRLQEQSSDSYINRRNIPGQSRNRLIRDRLRQDNQVESEIHGRLSYAISCIVLVLIGSTLGMMFRSGNFMSAFAVSIGPGLLAIVLITSGQHVAEGVPEPLPAAFKNPKNLGLILLWSGNAAVLAMGLLLYARLRRT